MTISAQYFSPFLVLLLSKRIIISSWIYRLAQLGFFALIPLAILFYPSYDGLLGMGAFGGIVAFYPLLAVSWSLILPKKYTYTQSLVLVVLLTCFIADAHEWFGQLMGGLGLPLFGEVYIISMISACTFQLFSVLVLYASFKYAHIKLDKLDYVALLGSMLSIPLMYSFEPSLDFVLTPRGFLLGFMNRFVWFFSTSYILLRNRLVTT